jgi:hypothetical protein
MRALVLVLVAACYSPDSRQWGNTDGGGSPVILVVNISGPGKVTIDNVGTCGEPRCMYVIPGNTQRQLVATPANEEHSFQQWTMSCSGEVATCSVVPVFSPTQVGAKFE